MDFKFEEYQSWFEVFCKLNFKAVEVINLLTDLRDIALRDYLTAEKLWQNCVISEILKSEMTPQQQVRAIKEKVAGLRYPMGQNIQQQLENTSRQVAKQFLQNLQISWDKTLERPGFTLQIYFKNSEAIDIYLPKLSSAETANELKRMAATSVFGDSRINS